ARGALGGSRTLAQSVSSVDVLVVGGGTGGARCWHRAGQLWAGRGGGRETWRWFDLVSGARHQHTLHGDPSFLGPGIGGPGGSGGGESARVGDGLVGVERGHRDAVGISDRSR